LVDIFRAEEDACLLGTDAMRDGVDVPGRSLRLSSSTAFLARTDILHKAARGGLSGEGGRASDYEMPGRMRLRQASGRLIRRADESRRFVLLDGMMPSRLIRAFRKARATTGGPRRSGG